MVEFIGFFLFVGFVTLVYGFLYAWMWKDREISGQDTESHLFRPIRLTKIRLPIPLLRIPLGQRWPVAE